MIRGWHDLVSTFTGVALLAVVTLPLAVLAACLLATARRRAGHHHPWRTSLAQVGILHGTVPFVWMTMLPGSRAGEVVGAMSLVPLRDLESMDTGQVVGNLLILASLGFFLPLLSPAWASLRRIVVLAAVCSGLIEVLQFALQLDRVTSVDDVLLNTAGAGLAALLSLPWWPRSGSQPDRRGVVGH